MAPHIIRAAAQPPPTPKAIFIPVPLLLEGEVGAAISVAEGLSPVVEEVEVGLVVVTVVNSGRLFVIDTNGDGTDEDCGMMIAGRVLV